MPVERIAPPPPLLPGDPAPWFKAMSIGDNPSYTFQNAAGRHILLALIGSSMSEDGAAMLDVARASRPLFDDNERAFFALTVDPADAGRLAPELPGMRFLFDQDGDVARRYGALADTGDGTRRFTPFWLLLDPMLRVLARFAADQGAMAIAATKAVKPVFAGPPPILAMPRIFEPELCRRLIAGYEGDGGTPSGFMRDVDGVTRELQDARHKRRSDWHIADPELRARISDRINRRLVPEIAKAFQFHATRIERHIVACYETEGGGYFRPHRDNTSFGTAHRRFAVTINLNAEEYDGGNLRFAEYSPLPWRATTGGAVVFSCSMLHEATPMLRGTRYCYLTFLYDDAAAQVREHNNAKLGEEVRTYQKA